MEHTDERREASIAFERLMESWSKVLPARKFEKFTNLVRWPLPTNEISKKIFADLKRVFDGKNRVVRHQFRKRELEQEFEEFKRKRLLDDEFWQEDVWEHLQTGINDILVVDPGEGGIPNMYIVPMENTVDLIVNRDNEVEYIIYDVDKMTRVVLDDYAFYVFRMTEKGEWVQLGDARVHGRPKAPAKPLWSNYKNATKNFEEKVGPISHILSDMDEIVFWDIANRYYQMHGAFPIYWEFRTECTYEDASGNACEGGYIRYDAGYEIQLDVEGRKTQVPVRRMDRCPECEKNENIGPGTTIGIAAPTSKDDPNLREPMGFVSVDKAALEFGEDKQNDRKQKAVFSAVGINIDPSSTQAMNPEQVSSFFEDKKSILAGVKRNMEIIHHWALDTIARMMYGADYISTEINYGDEFYLRSESELVDLYKTAKEAGLPQFMLKANRQILMETRWRTDPEMQKRATLLADLEPYPDMGITDLLALKNQDPDAVNPVYLLLKIRFEEFVSKFERENSDILIFGENISYREKVNKIQQRLLEYARAERSENQKFADDDAKRKIAREPKPEPAKGVGGKAGAVTAASRKKASGS